MKCGCYKKGMTPPVGCNMSGMNTAISDSSEQMIHHFTIFFERKRTT